MAHYCCTANLVPRPPSKSSKASDSLLELEIQTRNQELIIRTTDSMLISLTVGKVDAGVAVLLTEDKRLVSSTRAPVPTYPIPPNEHPNTDSDTPRSNFPPSFSLRP